MDTHDELAQYIPRLRRYARALIHNHELADDLVQDTLERALNHVDRFRAGTDLRAWLFAIMHNVFANQARKRSVRAVHVSVDDTGDLTGLEEHELAVHTDATRSLQMRDLDHALQRLSAPYREVILLVSLEEMSYADVASALCIPVGTVTSRLSRGREQLRELLAGKPVREQRLAVC